MNVHERSHSGQLETAHAAWVRHSPQSRKNAIEDGGAQSSPLGNARYEDDSDVHIILTIVLCARFSDPDRVET